MGTKRKATRRIARPKKRMTMTRFARPIRTVSRQVHKFIRGYEALNLPGNAVHAPYQGALSTSLAQVTNSGELTALYDQYMITYVKYLFFLEVDPGAQAAASAIYPKLYMVRDQDDSTVLSQNEMRERANCQIRVMNPDKPVIVSYKPNLLTTQWYNGVTNGYTPVWRKWLDASNPNIPHYGLKFNIDNLTNTNYRVRIETRVWIACKNSR